MCKSPIRHDHRSRVHNRRGAALVEGALIGSVFVLVLMAALDLSLAVLRYNTLSEAARRVARAAIVRGERASPSMSWGPEVYEAAADDDSDIAETARSILIALHPADVNVRVEWPDGGVQVNNRVIVSLSYDFEPLLSLGFGIAPVTLSSTSTMRICH